MTSTVSAPKTDVVQLDIEIGPSTGGEHPVRLSGSGRVVTATFRNPMRKAELGDANEMLDRGLVAKTQAKGLGSKLFDALFEDQAARQLLTETTVSGHARFRFVTSDGTSAAIPWELLYDDTKGVYLSQQGWVSRWIRDPAVVPKAPAPLLVEEPLRTLVVLANPRGDALDLDAEANAITKAFDDAVQNGRAADVTVLHSASRRELQDALREAVEAGSAYHVVHFAGHTGRTIGDPQPHLLLHGQDGAITPEAFARIVTDGDVRLVFINACGSLQPGVSVSGHLLPAFAGELTQRGVPAVVGSQVPLIDTFATQIAGDFYAAVLDGRSVDAALTDVRRLVEEKQSTEHANFGIPVCYLASGDGRLVEPPQQPKTVWGRYRRWIMPLILVGIPTLFTYVSIVSDVLPFFDGDPAPVPMSGDFNIAVAELGVAPPETTESKAQATALPDSLQQRLDDVLSCGTTTGEGGGLLYDCRGPAATGRFDGTNEERAAKAADYSDQANVHLVVYGTIADNGTTLAFAPEVFLSANLLTRAEELGGVHQLTPRTADASLLVTRQELRAEAVALADDLGQLALALSLYEKTTYAEALAIIRDLLDKGTFEIDKSLLLLVAGNLEGKVGNVEAAETSYQAAIDTTPGYARGWLGLGEIAFQRGAGASDCTAATIDQASLDESITRYEVAIGEPIKPPAANVDTKASFGIARSLTCLTIAGVSDHSTEASRRFQAVIAAHEAGARGLTEFASESYSFLAALGLHTASDGERPAALRRSIELNQDAIQTTRDNDRRATFLFLIADASRQLGDDVAACDAFQEAAQLKNPAAIAANGAEFGCV